MGIYILFSSLIVDDIEDDSKFRREKPCVHLIHGIDISINAGNFIYFLPMKAIMNNKKYSNKIKN